MKKPKKMSAKEAYRHAMCVIKGRFTEGEAIISKDSEWAYYYARDILKGRWLEAEKIIAQNGEYACYYAFNVVKGRFLEGEQVIAKHYWSKRHYLDFFFPNMTIVTRDEVGEFTWSRLGLEGYFADATLFERKTSLLDMVLSEE
jgi:hypothetical protein